MFSLKWPIGENLQWEPEKKAFNLFSQWKTVNQVNQVTCWKAASNFYQCIFSNPVSLASHIIICHIGLETVSNFQLQLLATFSTQLVIINYIHFLFVLFLCQFHSAVTKDMKERFNARSSIRGYPTKVVIISFFSHSVLCEMSSL